MPDLIDEAPRWQEEGCGKVLKDFGQDQGIPQCLLTWGLVFTAITGLKLVKNVSQSYNLQTKSLSVCICHKKRRAYCFVLVVSIKFWIFTDRLPFVRHTHFTLTEMNLLELQRVWTRSLTHAQRLSHDDNAVTLWNLKEVASHEGGTAASSSNLTLALQRIQLFLLL